MIANTVTSFIWYDLMTTDVDAAEAFYRAVIGWQSQDSGSPEQRYIQFTANGAMTAGLTAIPDEACAQGARPAWTGYIYADDVDAATARVVEAGGSVHRAPADIPGGFGRFAIVSDPQGAVFALYKHPGPAGQLPPPMTPGHAGWHELMTSDHEAALAFYADQFGWTRDQPVDMGPMGIYQLFAVNGMAIGGMMNKPAEMPHPAWLFYFVVDAADAAAARIVDHGGTVVHGPSEVPGGAWIVQAQDPQGAMFAVVAMKR